MAVGGLVMMKRRVSRRAMRNAKDDKADLLSLFWMMKKNQIIALNAISDAEKIGSGANSIISAADAMQAKLSEARKKIMAKLDDPKNSAEELCEAQRTNLYLEQLENCCRLVRVKADALYSEMNSYSDGVNNFIARMDEYSSGLLKDNH
jgi:hypothetical protein